MTVIAHTKSGRGSLRRRRDGASGRGQVHGEVASNPSARDANTALRRRHEAAAPQDLAIYTCSCGYVFEAQVSTSVDCPHCGDTQAW